MTAVMLDLEKEYLSSEEKELLQHPYAGGVILFSRNYKEPQQLFELVNSIRAASDHYLLIAVDQEGGRVQRFREGFSYLPPLGDIGKVYQRDKKTACSLAHQHAWLMASELLTFGIDFSFSPVLDLGLGISEVIGNRAFHAHPKVVAELAKWYLAGLKQAGMASVGKHFPGHGSVTADSHHEIPLDFRTFDEIELNDLIPFAECSLDLDAIMPAHIIFKEIDFLPVGFSDFWLNRVLREQLNFNGAIFSDDLSMEGASQIGDVPKRAQAALNAGCDMVLVCNDRKNAVKTLEDLASCQFYHDAQSIHRLNQMRGQRILTRKELSESPQWREAVNRLKIISSQNEKILI